jgi:hypothetical protein
MPATLQHIDEPRLETDLGYRFYYVSEFIGLMPEDVSCVLNLPPILGPLLDTLVDAVYVKLFTYDCTKRHFVPRQTGYEGALPTTLEDLTLDHDQIRFRKGHLRNYLVRLVTGPYDGKLVEYLDRVGKMHTPALGSKQLDVPIVQMNALMGFVSDALIGAIQGADLEQAKKDHAVRAICKLLWIQNDLISRHYTK